MIKRYVKKTFVEAIQFTGYNLQECGEFAGEPLHVDDQGEVSLMVDGWDSRVEAGDYLVRYENGYISAFCEDYFNNTFTECEVQQ